LQRDRRLRASEPARGFRDAAGLDDGDEGTQYAHVDTEEAHGWVCCSYEGTIRSKSNAKIMRDGNVVERDANECIGERFTPKSRPNRIGLREIDGESA
jgi:hypothetical protein